TFAEMSQSVGVEGPIVTVPPPSVAGCEGVGDAGGVPGGVVGGVPGGEVGDGLGVDCDGEGAGEGGDDGGGGGGGPPEDAGGVIPSRCFRCSLRCPLTWPSAPLFMAPTHISAPERTAAGAPWAELRWTAGNWPSLGAT